MGSSMFPAVVGGLGLARLGHEETAGGVLADNLHGLFSSCRM